MIDSLRFRPGPTANPVGPGSEARLAGLEALACRHVNEIVEHFLEPQDSPRAAVPPAVGRLDKPGRPSVGLCSNAVCVTVHGVSLPVVACLPFQRSKGRAKCTG